MGCCDSPRKPTAKKKDPVTQPLLQQQARNSSIQLQQLNVINVVLPTVYYVIIGRGPMAVVNHRTLLESQWGLQRIGNHRIIHVGFPNPWPKYLKHGLGQPNHLLSFPAFRNQPSVGGGPPVDGGLDSQHFGAQVDAEFNSLNLQNNQIVEEWVALIQSRNAAGQVDNAIATESGGNTVDGAINAILNQQWPAYPNNADAPYRVCLYHPTNQTARWIYAAKIDICTGPGRPNAFAPSRGDTQHVIDARTPPWLTPEKWSLVQNWIDRKVMNGVDAIRDEVQWLAGDRICITAGGGVGLNAAEKGGKKNCLVDWFGRDGLMNPVFNNPRNLTFLKHPITNNQCTPGPRLALNITNEDHLIPFHARARMGRGAILASTGNSPNAIEVWLVAKDNNTVPAIRDSERNSSGLNAVDERWELSVAYANAQNIVESRVYTRLVIPNGQNTSQPGQPFSFAHHLGLQPVVEEGRMVALETADHLVRVLGAACNNYPGQGYTFGEWTNGGRLANTPAFAMWTYHASLPVSAVTDGFIICGTNTALANRYFTNTAPNKNVNTMTLAQIRAVVGNNFGDMIYNARNARNGYKDRNDVIDLCGQDDNSFANLEYAYPALP